MKTLLFATLLFFFYNSSFAEEMGWIGKFKYTDAHSDILAHLYVRDNSPTGDRVHQTHERTQAITAQLRNDNKGYEWFYVLNDRVFRMKMPYLTIKQIAKNVPQKQRTQMYRTYLTDPLMLYYWNKNPEFLLDELTAYHNGTVCAIEDGLGRKARGKYSYKNFVEMLGFCEVMRRMVNKEYDAKDLDLYLNFMRKRKEEIGILVRPLATKRD